MRIGFIGAGKVGFSLGRYFVENGLTVSGYYSRNIQSRTEASRFTRTKAFDELADLLNSSDTVFITVPDSAIREVYEQIRDIGIAGKLICHCSGAMSALEAFPDIARYGGPYGLTYSYREYADSIDPILKKVIDCGKALECNTGGMSRGLSDPNPSFDVLRRYKELGGELITLGSDAHSPDTLGYEFDKVGDILKSIGFRYYAVFRNRRPCMYPL